MGRILTTSQLESTSSVSALVASTHGNITAPDSEASEINDLACSLSMAEAQSVV